MIHLCHYKFIKVEFYPFGGITKIDKPINSSVNKEILIASSGIFVQLVLALLLFVMKQHHINFDGIDFMGKMNWTILIFNCLPIIPLDGSVIFHSFLEKIFSFEKSFTFYEVISCFCLILFTIINYTLHLDNYYICFVLAAEYILLKKEKKYLLHRFYLERLLKEYPYKRIQNEKNRSIHCLKKETLHFYYEDGKYIHEQEKLQKYFKKY